jgi:hypothetical protein
MGTSCLGYHKVWFGVGGGGREHVPWLNKNYILISRMVDWLKMKKKSSWMGHEWNGIMDAFANTYLTTWGEHYLLQFDITCFK